MGPYPHDAPPPEISKDNPAGTDGFEFVEFAHPEPEKLAELFGKFGFTPVARHKTKNITLYRQGDINYILNAEPNSFGMKFVDKHGPCAPVHGLAGGRCRSCLPPRGVAGCGAL